ncbi:class I SAM-dependent methyltransferase, partial [Candidatus Peregrinibacteria bacterium]|nr:class I SAM-dependent methyltransferase [Candidatus Peregrinibacteria bacterium]
EAMITECTKKFPGIEFRVGDARKLPFTEPFDFIIFSFNGIDNMPHEDRLMTLRSIHSLIKSGGYYAFSTHNIFGARKLFSVQLNRNLRRTCMSLRRWLKTRSINPSWKVVSGQDHCVIHEGAHALKLKQYYIKPMAQTKQLEAAGFTDVHVFELTGNEIPAPYYSEDNWLYYLCRRK